MPKGKDGGEAQDLYPPSLRERVGCDLGYLPTSSIYKLDRGPGSHLLWCPLREAYTVSEETPNDPEGR